jgi:hypothetical protein
MSKFGFKKKGEKVLEKAIDEVQERHDTALELAKRCLHMPEFRETSQAYAELERTTINKLLAYAKVETDPLRFAFGAKDLLNKIESVRAFVNAVNVAAGEKL